MNYIFHYNTLINSYSLLSRKKNNIEYYERHHILPKCFGGTNSKDNLILLTAKEHYIAHLLLFKIHIGKNKAKMSYALFRMCCINSQQKRLTSSKQFESAKLAMITSSSGEYHPSYGIKYSPDFGEKIHLRMLGENNHRFNKHSWNFGLTKDSSESMLQISKTLKLKYTKEKHPCSDKPRSDFTKLAISNGLKGKHKTESHKQKISDSLKDRPLSKETKLKMSIAKQGIKQQIGKCPHCQKECSLPTLSRWHMDNCKSVI
jgi:hypothetical protein